MNEIGNDKEFNGCIVERDGKFNASQYVSRVYYKPNQIILIIFCNE